jgi:methylmalonyl-CoA/ethylmalonyl-CoA epimerase
MDKIKQVALHAEDLEVSVAFYRDILNASFTAQYDPPGIAFFEFSGVRLLLEKGAHKGTLYFEVEDIDQRYDDLMVKGVEFDQPPHAIFDDTSGTFGPAGQQEWMAFFKDPAGNVLALASRR